MINIILILIIIISSGLYLWYIVKNFGILSSISASYNYLKPGVSKDLYRYFIVFVALPMGLLVNNWIGWLAGGFLLFDYVFPAGDGSSKEIEFFHSMGAWGGIIGGFAVLGFTFHQWWLVITGVSVIAITMILKDEEIKIFKWRIRTGRFQFKNETWWVECEALIAVIIGLIIEKL